jgi:hypothetical protein
VGSCIFHERQELLKPRIAQPRGLRSDGRVHGGYDVGLRTFFFASIASTGLWLTTVRVVLPGPTPSTPHTPPGRTTVAVVTKLVSRSHHRRGGIGGPVGPLRSVQCDTQVASPPQLSAHGALL